MQQRRKFQDLGVFFRVVLGVALLLSSERILNGGPRKVRQGKTLYESSIGEPSTSELLLRGHRLAKDQTITIGSIVFYATSAAESAAAPSPVGDHCDFVSWRGLIGRNKDSSECPPTRQILKIGHVVAFRVVDKRCAIHVTTLNDGRDPFHVDLGNARVEIIDIAVPRLSPHESNQYPITPEVFARTNSEPTEELGRKLLMKLVRVTGASQLALALRPDMLFFRHCNFPTRFPFDPAFRVPTEQYAAATHEVYCAVFGSPPIFCSQLGTAK